MNTKTETHRQKWQTESIPNRPVRQGAGFTIEVVTIVRTWVHTWSVFQRLPVDFKPSPTA